MLKIHVNPQSGTYEDENIEGGKYVWTKWDEEKKMKFMIVEIRVKIKRGVRTNLFIYCTEWDEYEK